MALRKGKFWNPDRPLSIGFVSQPTDPNVRKGITDAVDAWQAQIGMKLNLNFTREGTDINIGFALPGFFSLLGTDSRVKSLRRQYRQQSLNIQERLREDYFAVALHELGHALGAIHEHQSPSADIPWDKRAVERYYAGSPNFWTKDDVQEQIFYKYSQTQVNASAFDDKSIMLYPVPARLLLPGKEGRAVGFNGRLSSGDMAFIKTVYLNPVVKRPAPPPDPVVPATPGETRTLQLGSQLTGNITIYAEAHLYRITTNAAGKYFIETIESDPSINMNLELFGDRGLTNRLASASYGGRRLLNARIVTELEANTTYYVRARHANRPGTGRYVISFHQ